MIYRFGNYSLDVDRQELRWVERVAARMVHAPEGDFRDHDEIRRWASGVASALTIDAAACS